jgi:hypothetical protein
MSALQYAREPSPEMLEETQQIRAIRIVSLPCELQSTYDVSMFVKQMIGLDSDSVNIVPMQTNSGVRYRSAFLDIIINKDSDVECLQQIADFGITIQGSDIPGGIHFDNGKSMSHMKVTSAKPHSPSKDTLVLEDGEWSSIYIPVIPSDLTMDNGDMRYNEHDTLVEFFEDQLKIGEVSRIDFMSKTVPGTDREARCAYVHFDKWYDNQTSKLVRKTISSKGEFSCNGFYDGFEFRKFERSRFITLKVNHKPIPAATEDMNIHQLAARVKMLEEQNARLEEQLVKPPTVEEAFKQLRKKMEEFKGVSEELFEKYGSSDAAEAAGVWESPEYKEYAFDYVGTLNELYEEFVPVIFRGM